MIVSRSSDQTSSRPEPTTVDLLVAGAIALDTSCDFLRSSQADELRLHTSNPASISQSVGGVGHNIAKAAHSLGASTRLFTNVADDIPGRVILTALKDLGMDVGAVRVLSRDTGAKTAQYIALNDVDKSLVYGMADMSYLQKPFYELDASCRSQMQASSAKWLAVDANWSVELLRDWLDTAKQLDIKVAFEPVSIAKCTRILEAYAKGKSARSLPTANLMTPNTFELSAMHAHAREQGLFETQVWWQTIDALGISSAGAHSELIRATSRDLVMSGLPQQSIQLLPFIPCILTKLGKEGVLLTQILPRDDDRLNSPDAAPYILSRTKYESGPVGGLYVRLFPAHREVEQSEIVSVNGVGDTFLGAVMAALALKPGSNVEDTIDFAQSASVLSLLSAESVSPDLKTLSSQIS